MKKQRPCAPRAGPEVNVDIMSDPSLLPFDAFHLAFSGSTAERGRAAGSRRVRCRFAQGSDSGPGLTDQMAGLLRTRLRLAILIILCGFVFFFVRNLLEGGLGSDLDSSHVIFDGCEIAAMAVVSGILWSRWPLCPRTLRIIELTIFGSIAAFFALLQSEFLCNGILLQWVDKGQEVPLFRLLGIANAFRWFILIVIYGTFVPNTWRRCAAVVGAMALIPIALTVAGSFLDPVVAGYARLTLPETVMVIAMSAAVAVFGSYKIRELHEKAYEAQRIGQYRLKKRLGAGGMGEVYLAEHVMLRRPCAIKLIRPDQAGDPRTMARFEREVRATATLTHWNTIEIYDYGHAEDGTFYYVMEYLPGMNLEELVGRYGPLPAERAVHLLRQVCQALREAHGIGLIHRDIKPSNVFACERGRVHDVAKLLDFGLVKSFGLNGNVKLTQEGGMAGSPAYMSPEQVKGREELDARSDIYTLGAVAYFLVTGRLLFERESPLELLHAHAFEPVAPHAEFQKDVPDDLQKVILRCLEKDPARRYQDVESLERALAACAGAGQWTEERAQEWWRQNGASAVAEDSLDAVQRDGPTLLVKSG